MGISTSSLSEPSSVSSEAISLYSKLIQSSKGNRLPSPLSNIKSTATISSKTLTIDPRARLLNRFSFNIDVLWETFLNSNNPSFAITPSEMKALLLKAYKAILQQSPNAEGDLVEIVTQEINDYVGLLTELSTANIVTSSSLIAPSNNVPIALDFMATISSSLLLTSDIDIEQKIDKLFFWIALDPDIENASFGFEEFYVALSSFERGVSHAFGYRACSEEYVRAVATNWIVLADPSYLKSSSNTISNKQFFDFATNRLHVVRRLLESIAQAARKFDDDNDTSNDNDQPTISSSKFDIPTLGDQWLANPPWKKTAEKMVPSNIQSINMVPAESLILQWCHGYRGYDCRNNIYHLPMGNSGTSNTRYMLFYAAGLLIAQGYRPSRMQQSQSFFSLHADDVIALAISPFKMTDNNAVIASGEIGKSPAIHISTWSLNESDGSHHFDSRLIIQGFHSQGISQLAFSSSGNILFSIGINYSIAAYDLSSAAHGKYGRMLYSTQGPKDKVMHLCHGLNDDHFLSCGEKHVILWKAIHDNGNICKSFQQYSVKLGQMKSKTFLSCVAISNGYVVSSADGDLCILQWNSSSTQSSDPLLLLPLNKTQTQCHDKGIPSLWSSADGSQIVSGGKDGRLILWQVKSSTSSTSTSTALAVQPVYISPTPITTSSIRAISVSEDLRSIAFGTMKCEIFEWTNERGLPLDQFLTNQNDKASLNSLTVGHFKDELWGLATKYQSVQFATTGDDGYLRIWDALLNKQIFELDLVQSARCCCYSGDGVYLAIGMGSFASSSNNNNKLKTSQKSSSSGSVRVYRHDQSVADSISLSLVIEIKEAKGAITAIKFSPDNNILAAGSKDGAIYFYSSIQQFKQKSKFSKHNSSILSFDFSSDGKFLQSCCQAYEILFCEVATGNQIFGTSLLDVSWKTWTCSLGWAVMGIWSGTMDGSDVNAVDRSPSGKLLANGDDFSHVNLFRYPAIVKDKGNLHNAYAGHSSHVTNVRWIDMGDGKDECLISCGGADKCVFVWKVVGSNDLSPTMLTSRNNAHQGMNNSQDIKLEEVELGFDDLPSGGDEFLAVKPWLSAIVQPTAWANPDLTKQQAYLSALSEFASLHQKLFDQPNNRSYEELKMLYRDIQLASENTLIKYSESGYLPDISAPFDSDELIIEHIHGYRGDLRNNVFSVRDGDTCYIIYPAAAVVVIDRASGSTNTEYVQRYFRGHSDDVLCLAVHGTTAASGQQGVGPTFVWDISSLKPLAVISTRQKNVQLLSFTSDGRLLVTLGGDNSLNVHDWQSNVSIASTKLDGAISFQLLPISLSNNSFVVAGDKFIKVWTLSGRNLSGTRTTTSSVSSKPLQYLSMVNISNKILFGSEDGNIYVSSDGGKSLVAKFDHFSDRGKEDKSLSKNELPVTSMTYSPQLRLLVTGAKVGSISVWNCDAFESATVTGKGSISLPVRCFNISVTNIPGLTSVFAKAIHSLSFTSGIIPSDDVSLIVGTRGCDLFEISFKLSTELSNLCLKRIITRGHCNDEVWGLATHPTKPEYATTGDDKTLRFFSLREGHRQSDVVPLGHMSRCCSYSPDGSCIAVGFGGRVGKGKAAGDGLIRVYSCSSTHEQLAERHDAKQWVSDIKFSSDSKTIIMCSHDCKIYIYNWSSDKASLTLRCSFSKHHAAVSHLDISSDGQYFQSTCNAYELLYGECLTGKQVQFPQQLKDMKWETWTLPLGWCVQGIWSPGMDGTDINSVCRAHGGNILATGDDFGHVNLFRLPCLDSKAISLRYGGIHSSHVSNVRWTVGDEYLISCGGNDRCVVVWKHKLFSTAGTDIPSSPPTFSVAVEDIDMIEVPSGGDEFLAVKPWLGAIRPPPFPPSIDKSAPNVNCNVKWVFGYSSYATMQNVKVANNLAYNVDGEIIYPAAALAIRYAPPTATSPASQRYFHGHNDDVLCLAISHDRRIIATGQISSKSTNKNTKGNAGIILWDAVDSRILSSIPSCHQRGVAQLSFSSDNTQLVSVGMDDQQTHILWSDTGGHWSKIQKTSEAKNDKGLTLFVKWLSNTPTLTNQGCLFISGGSTGSTGYLNYWFLEGAKLTKKCAKMSPKIASLMKKKEIQSYCCGANIQDQVIIGTSAGTILLFNADMEAAGVIEAHDGPILSISVAEGLTETWFITGGKDGKVRVWSSTCQPLGEYSVVDSCVFDCAIGSLDIFPSSTGAKLLVGTHGGDILQLLAPIANDKGKGVDIARSKIDIIVRSHAKGELWGISLHPLNPDIFASVGDDGTIRIWSIRKTRMIGFFLLPPNHRARSCTWHPLGNILVVSSYFVSKKKESASNIHLYDVVLSADTVTFHLRYEGKVSSSWISDMRFTPDGTVLAVCCHDRKIYFYKASVDADNNNSWNGSSLKKPVFIFQKHSSAVLHIDFSADGNYWQSCCQAGDLLYGNVTSGIQETSATKFAPLNNALGHDDESTNWSTHSSKLGWPVQGIWSSGMDLSDINAVDRNYSCTLLGVATDEGDVRIFRYPVVNERSEFTSGKGHSSHVTNVRWTIDGSLVTAGGRDQCLFIWELQEL